MKIRAAVGWIAGISCALAAVIGLAAQDSRQAPSKAAVPASQSDLSRPNSASSPASNAADAKATTLFQPPAEANLPQDEFGKVIKLGMDIFQDTKRHAGKYVGKDSNLRCASCHLDAGRLANSAPLWGAYVSYPTYRSKNKHVNTFQERLQGCFNFSMNGKPPPFGDPVLVALESYAYWLASGAPIDPKIRGRGYPKVPDPPMQKDFVRGKLVFEKNCAICHGANGEGQADAKGNPNFPALWGKKSYNWGAGMSSIKNAAGFIKANMPLGLGGTLSDQEAWDVAMFIDSQDRPQDPRFKGSIAQTRARYHDSDDDMYGLEVNGHLLGK